MEKTSTEPSDKSAPTVPPPFDKPADLILRSSDGIDYNVYRCILILASPIFADMWSLPQPTPPSHRSHQADTPDLPVVAIPETAKTLETLLRLIYPLSTVPDFASMDDFKAAFLVAHKYEIDYTKTVLSSALSKFSGLEPLRMYAMAVRYDLPDVARLAARGFLLMQDPLAMIDEVKELDVVAYHRLLVYRARCTNSLKTLGDTSLTSYFKMSSRVSPYAWTWIYCKTCHPRLPNQYGHRCTLWFKEHWKRLFIVLAATPSADALADPALNDEAMREVAKCETCGPLAPRQLRKFTTLFAADVKDRLSEVPF
ncbi:hypothetical protein PYCCODRAFT_1228188 [Trametes coccinea BRFM310]|uniref:BTB domain-containing protein n=1 Tax=Trametes coccinea (strain BRFM310) TaxID=1353009 RepID=A0A1Y2IW74_TRAC3|nr:hypothetical protein PYCCODRAFT_1228188 [Trametes coccinea BRFM310]